MTPTELKNYLQDLIKNQLPISTMIWGPPGIGKSSIVGQIAQEAQLEFIDLRLSQLAPTDLRGLPVPLEIENINSTIRGVSTWYPPEFLPTSGKGILFLDELNMAPPAMQGIAQQLILDRRVGAYEVPDGWYIWAAGNRKEDRASVFEMPAPLANRFLHLQVASDFESFKTYALASGINEQIIAFLAYRPSLLHKVDLQSYAWPSPRSWEMASKLHSSKMDIVPAIGEGAAAEFNAFVNIYQNLPDLTPILNGYGASISFPQEPSIRYATTIGLTVRVIDVSQACNVFKWLSEKASSEWTQLFCTDIARLMRDRGKFGLLVTLIKNEPQMKNFFSNFETLLAIA